MPRRIQNITDQPIQRHTVLFADSEVTVTLRYYPTTQCWVLDAEYEGRRALGYRLTLGVTHMAGRNLPFDFVVQDRSNTGVDPFKRDDFESGRCRLFILDPPDVEELRGAPVQI